jgi:hypothetical protein
MCIGTFQRPSAANEADFSKRRLPQAHPFALHLTTVWLTIGAFYPTWAPVAVFGIVINLNFVVVMACRRDYGFGRDLIRQQGARIVPADVVQRIPGIILDFAALFAHAALHVVPALYFAAVSSPIRVRDVALALPLQPIWCTLASGTVVKGRMAPWCNCSALYANRSDEFWRFAFQCAYAHLALVALFALCAGRL